MKISSRMDTWRATVLQGTPGFKSLAKGPYEPQAGLGLWPLSGHDTKSQYPQCSFPAQFLTLPSGRLLLPPRPAAFSLETGK